MRMLAGIGTWVGVGFDQAIVHRSIGLNNYLL